MLGFVLLTKQNMKYEIWNISAVSLAELCYDCILSYSLLYEHVHYTLIQVLHLFFKKKKPLHKAHKKPLKIQRIVEFIIFLY